MDEKVIEAMKEEAPLDWDKAQALADKFGVKVRAVVASATRQGIEYKRKERATKTGAPVVSKAELVERIAEKFGIDPDQLDGLEKATKLSLQRIAE